MGEKGFVSLAPWPEINEQFLVEDVVALAVQVNGKKRGIIETAKDASQDQALSLAKAIPTVTNAIGEGEIKKVIYVPGKILNLIVK